MTRLHINDDAHLLHIVRGKATIFIEERQYTLRPGLAVAIAPFTRFYFQIPSAFEMLNVHYRLWLADGALLEEALALPEIFRPRRFSVSVEKLRAMQKLRQSAAQDPAQMAVYAHAVILNYLVNVPLQPKASGDGDARLAPVCRKLRDPAYAKFQAAELARAGGMSVSQMNRVFKKCFGLAPHQYWERQRFFAVCFHLRAAGGASIEEVAQQFGFDDAGYFFRWFKKMAGCTPAVFRRHIHQGAI